MKTTTKNEFDNTEQAILPFIAPYRVTNMTFYPMSGMRSIHYLIFFRSFYYYSITNTNHVTMHVLTNSC